MTAEPNELFHTTSLPNGLTLVGQHLPGVQSTAIGYFIGAGAQDEVWEQAGVGHLAEATMFRGTNRHSSRELTERFDSLGIARSSSSGVEMSAFTAVLLDAHVLSALELLTEVVTEPAFADEEIDAVRALQLQEIGQREDQPAQLAMEHVRQLYFAGSPLSHDVLGSRDSVSGLTRDQVVDYWSQHYAAGNAVLAVTGSFDWDSFAKRAGEITAGWEPGTGRTRVEPPAVNPGVVVEQNETAQENLAFAFHGVPQGDDRFYAAALVAMVLGGGMNSRLFTEVREKRGLAYSVGCRFDGMETAGINRIYVGTQPERAHESRQVVRSEVERLSRDSVTADELDRAKVRLKSAVVMNGESTANRLSAAARDWWYRGRLRSLAQVREEIDAVSLDLIREYLDSIRPAENLGLVAIGPLAAADLGVEQRAFEVKAE